MKLIKQLLLVILVFSAQNILAQENGSLFLSAETLKKTALSFGVEQAYVEYSHPDCFSTANWKYHPGDDKAWKETAFNDSSWKLFHTDFNLDSIPKGEWQGIGWFRLKLVIDSNLYDQSLALVMTQFGASEIYFDGKLVNQYGIPSKDPFLEKTFRPLNFQPVIVSLDEKSEHLLAVRYSFHQAQSLLDKYNKKYLFKTLHFGYPGFMMNIGSSKGAVKLFGDSLFKNLLLAIITFIALLLIGIFHTSFFIFYSSDRSNLYLAIFNFTVAAFSFSEWLPSYSHLSLQAAILNNLFAGIIWNFWLPVSMLAYYSVFYRKLPWHVWIYFAVILFMFSDLIFNSTISYPIYKWFMYVAFADMLRLFVKSVINREKNVWIVGVGVILSQSCWMLYLNSTVDWINTEFIVYCILLVVPVSLLIFNASRTAETSKSLEKQLVEVTRLSDLSLTKEREKQQILTSQKSVLEHQVNERTADLNQSLEDLKSTQSQLIQSEKMASLGELTAGIAHEIQNPLNFVNNFSEVNTELIGEMEEEIDKGNLDEAKKIAKDIRENQQKINQHGKRADSIVKGMLQHSRSSSGIKELTDINLLADEFLRLSYHGLRAKDKSFNASLKTDFDPAVGKIRVVTEEIGRVILNLLNNAFYAVTERKKLNAEGYEPTVTIGTKMVGDRIEIRVSDNGYGIPQKVLDKIFQPFFTTKPTGQGTGLGLSLSYDIITKGHDGQLMVETNEGVGSTFIINLPYNNQTL
ncbi:MAG: ATP-binding protein [Bacteroidia bacterium]|nr:ATP-binding protein [Bacteroidia bacterium]